jgi:solute carrier family 12 sodium/potassium/chloride transporter 2
MNVAVAILRLQEGLDCSEILADIDDLILNKTSKDKTQSYQADDWSIINRDSGISTNPDTPITS